MSKAVDPGAAMPGRRGTAAMHGLSDVVVDA